MTTILRTDDMKCPSCVAALEKMLAGVAGVEHATVRFSSGKIEVRHDSAQVGVDELVKRVRTAGYRTRVSVI